MIKCEDYLNLILKILIGMSNSLLRFVLAFFLFGMPLSLLAQINIKVGYVPALGTFESISNLFTEYNSTNSDIVETPFNELRFIHGIDVGLRYKFGVIGVEADWSNLSRERDVLLYFSQSDSFDSRLYKIGISSISIGLDSYFDRFGMGVGIHSQQLKIGREIGSNNLNLINETNLAVDLHLNITLQKGSKVSLIAKPYYRFSVEDFNLTPFSQDLLDKDAPSGGIAFYGISLIFYNGKKS